MSRYQAFITHLGISIFILAIVLGAMKLIWYPDFYFEINGGWEIIKVLIGVDVVLGPLLTLVVFKSGKPSLKFDLSVIAAIQVAALYYGCSIIYAERPAYLVFAVNTFEVVSASELAEESIIPDNILALKRWGPLAVFAEMPKDEIIKSKILTEVLDGGPDLSRRPEYFRPLLDNLETIINQSLDTSSLIKSHKISQQSLSDFINEHGDLGRYSFHPAWGKSKDIIIAIQKSNGKIVTTFH